MIKLQGGQTIAYSRKDPVPAPNADPPWIKATENTLTGGSAACTLLDYSCVEYHKLAKRPTQGSAAIWKADDGTTWLVVSGKVLNAESAAEITYRADGTQHFTISKIGSLFKKANLELNPMFAYKLKVQLVEHPEYGVCLGAIWSEAELVLREGDSGEVQPAPAQAAAATQQQG